MNHSTDRDDDFTCANCGDNMWIVLRKGLLRCISCKTEKKL